MNLTSRTFLACYFRSLKNNYLDYRAKQVVTEAANKARGVALEM